MTRLRLPPRAPVTNSPLPAATLTPNVALRNVIAVYLEQRPELRLKPAKMTLEDVRAAVDAFEQDFTAKGRDREQHLRALEAELAAVNVELAHTK
mmetsp:Transcript_6970/g.18476  ORF Transcript_6970/g.18476 Transcript_6970/m.18476 type:complete len:95 (-) Transcript_6970:343-627(-)